MVIRRQGRMIIRPYDPDDPMHVIRHDDPFVDDGMWEMGGDLTPTIGGNAPCLIQRHAPIGDGAEQGASVLSAYGYKIVSWLSIVLPLEAY